MDPDLRQGDRCRHRSAADLPARHRRAGARDRRHAGALRCDRRRRHRLGGGPHAPRRDRRRDGRHPRRPAGPPDEPGPAQAHRQPQQDQHHHHLHQPAPREDRRDVRLTRDHARRAGAEVLLVGPPRHPSHRVASRTAPRSSATAPGSRSSRTRCAPPFRQAEFDIMYGKGISREGSLLDMAVDMGIVKKSGAWFTYEGEQLGQGRENAKSYLKPRTPRSWSRSARRCVVAAGLDKQVDGAADEVFTEADEAPIDDRLTACADSQRVSPWSRSVSPTSPGQLVSTSRSGWRRSPGSQDDISFFELGGFGVAVFGPASLADDAGWSSSPSVEQGAFRGVALASTSSHATRSMPRSPSGSTCGGTPVEAARGACSGAATRRTSPTPTVICGRSPTTRGFPTAADGTVHLPDG